MALQLSGEYVFPVDRQKLWVYLNDPEVLAICIPGCTGMVQTGNDAYEANLKLQVASVGGTFKGNIALSDKQEPETCRITVQGSGTIGHGTGNARFELQPVSDHETKLIYEGSGEVGGLVAGVGQRVLGSVSKFLTKKFLAALDKHIRHVAQA